MRDGPMPIFKVKCYNAGLWDQVEPREVEANSEHEAAERICGRPLTEHGVPGRLRAEVYLPSQPGKKKLFYIPGTSS
jgi:hypothetical protein